MKVVRVKPGTMPATVLRTDAQMAPGHAPGRGGLPPILRSVEWGMAGRVMQSKGVTAEIHFANKLWTAEDLLREQRRRY